jgi:hypothetical protein
MDCLMDQRRDASPGKAAYTAIVTARNKNQHEVISIVTFADLDPAVQRECSEDVYECLRTTCLLYANLVTFPLPLQSGWQLWFIARLQTLHSRSLDLQRQEYTNLSVWSLWVAAMAAYHTGAGSFFAEAQGRRSRDYGVYEWSAIKSVLQRYMWSEHACDEGSRVLWHAIERTLGPRRGDKRLGRE